jgi:DNA-binding NtrC family response regulator
MRRPVIYLLDGDPTRSEPLRTDLATEGDVEIDTFDSPDHFFAAVAEAPPDALLALLPAGSVDAVDLSRRVRRTRPYLPLFVVTAPEETEGGVQALRAGATGYLQQPVDVREVESLVRNALEVRPLIHEAATLRRQRRRRFSVEAVRGDHPLLDEVRSFVRRIAPVRRASVLLVGERGVGKKLVARTLHYSDPVARGPLVELNCAAAPAERLEAALFGCADAADGREPGLVETADGGTLVLDEVSGLPPALQDRVVDLLASGRFRRRGGTRERSVDVRIVAATTRDPDELRREPTVRGEFLQRIAAASHTLPPLRAMPEVVPDLAHHFAAQLGAELGTRVEGFTDEAMASLTARTWPGNARELRNAVERALLLCVGPRIDLADLPVDGAAASRRAPPRPADHFALPAGLTLKEAEAEYIRQTLDRMDHRIQDSAEVLGISRKNLWEKRKKHGLME